MFTAERTFSLINKKSGLQEWYFQAREGNVGPYRSKKQAELMLQKFIHTCILVGATGGRGQKADDAAASLKVKQFIDYEAQGDINWV